MEKSRSESYVSGFTEELRASWLSSLYDETIEDARHNADARNNSENKSLRTNIILDNWRREAWRPSCCKTTRPQDPCSTCEWLKIYVARHHSEDVQMLARVSEWAHLKDPKECVLIRINDFINTRGNDQLLDKNIGAHEGLKLLLNFICVWLWFLDEVNGTIYFPKGSNPAGNSTLAQKFIRSMELPLGRGSNGFALRLNMGICVSDTFADPRGGVAVEDIVARNFSYIATPIREKRDDGQKGKIVAYTALSYPLSHAWHERGRETCNSLNCEGTRRSCFYCRFKSFLEDDDEATYAPTTVDLFDTSVRAHQAFANRIQTLYQSMLDEKLTDKIRDASDVSLGQTRRMRHNLKEKSEDLRWKNLLQALTIQGKSELVGKDAFGINWASIWRVKPGVGDVECLESECNATISKKHLSSLIIRSNRQAYLDQFDAEGLYGRQDNLGCVSADSWRNAGSATLPLICKVIMSEKGPKAEVKRIIEHVLSRRREEILERIEFIEKLTDEGYLIYSKAYEFSVGYPPSNATERMVRKKLYEGFSGTVLSNWAQVTRESGTLDNGPGINQAINYWFITGQLTDLSIMKYSDELFNAFWDEIDPIILADIVGVCFYVLMPTNIGETYQLAYSSYPNSVPWRFIDKPENADELISVGDRKIQLKAFMERNLKGYDTLMTIDRWVNFCEENELNIQFEGKEFISSGHRWASVLSQGFPRAISRMNKRGDKFVVFHRDETNLAEVSWDAIEELSDLEKKLAPQYIGETPSFTLHMKRALPYAFVYIDKPDKIVGSDQEEDVNATDRGLIEKGKEDMEASLKPFIRDLLNHVDEIDKDSSAPLLLWDVYSGTGHWRFNEVEPSEKEPSTSLSTLDYVQPLHRVGSHALFVYPLRADDDILGLLLAGRSLIHPERAGYVSFTDQQKDVIDSFSSLANSWFQLLREKDAVSNTMKQITHSMGGYLLEMTKVKLWIGIINGFATISRRKLGLSMLELIDITRSAPDHEGITRIILPAAYQLIDRILKDNPQRIENTIFRFKALLLALTITLADQVDVPADRLEDNPFVGERNPFHGFGDWFRDIWEGKWKHKLTSEDEHRCDAEEAIDYSSLDRLVSYPGGSFEVIIEELFRNMRKYSKRGGKVRVACCYDDKKKKLHLSVENEIENERSNETIRAAVSTHAGMDIIAKIIRANFGDSTEIDQTPADKGWFTMRFAFDMKEYQNRAKKTS